MDKYQKLGYDVAFGILGLLLMGAGVAFIYSHSWLNQYNPTIEQAALMFSENFREEHDLMENVRVISGFSLVPLSILTLVASHEYYLNIENAVWELKKGLGVAVLGIPLGGFMYYSSTDLMTESLGLAYLFLGSGFALISGAYLIYLSGNSQTATGSAKNSSSSSYCSNCGNAVSKKHSFCQDCGTEL